MSRFDSIVKVLVFGRPSKPDESCEFTRFFTTRLHEWKDLRRIIFFLVPFWIIIAILAFLPVTKEAQVSIIAAFLTVIGGLLAFCALQWYRHESVFRFIVERCITLAMMISNGSDTNHYISDTVNKIESERIK
jgi:hypothetical protein